MNEQNAAEGRPPVTERTMQIDDLKTRIERDEYDVDPHAVAAAILALLLRRQSRCS
jgi:hypothetical protein